MVKMWLRFGQSGKDFSTTLSPKALVSEILGLIQTILKPANRYWNSDEASPNSQKALQW